ncbi:winged helix-turn-helix domain-containing protein [Lelliottia sp. CFBP8978]|uniref:winged helix-turn-helix domain-containing protein n=1 Tax=Lelliottia sp. CFBP8978 TaxID=3096522 RepID=UPI002A6B8FAC|nr:winged helix-turn-helix domain-containing protein [Lelliottia sp. CFBP8978]MDY1036671.1 winged helix-turn-helix domain-containing protein [Lelliottia sp. CFBP8978]
MTTRDTTLKKVFLINDTLLFEPELRQIGPRVDYPRRAVKLHGPVSECLSQLLEHNNQVLSQRFLFASVWEKNGVVVSTNALYQTIATIRKTLKSAGLDENIIKTIPKEGFKSVARLHVGELDEFLAPQMTSPVSVLPEESAAPETAATVVVEDENKPSFFHSPLAYGLAGILFILSCAVLYFVQKEEASPLADYQHIGKVNNCDLYSSWHDKDKSIEMFADLSRRYAIQCKADEMVWITVNLAQQVSSAIICDQKPEDAGAQCDSIVYRQQYHDEE